MSEELYINNGNKVERYATLLPQLQSLWAGERNRLGILSNTVAALRQTFHFFWVGFYLTEEYLLRTPNLHSDTDVLDTTASTPPEDLLHLGPFQGDIACTIIKKGKGVCGTAWAQQKTLIVPDVELFPGHIACSSLSQSEIVIPLPAPAQWQGDSIIGLIDIDSDTRNAFDATDQQYLETLATMVTRALFN